MEQLLPLRRNRSRHLKSYQSRVAGTSNRCGKVIKCRERKDGCNGIKVDIFYEVTNGLSGMKRDALLHLCHVVEMHMVADGKYIDQNIKAVMGMCQEHMRWKNHSYFINNRIKFMSSILASFRPNPKQCCKLTRSTSGERCTYTRSFLRTIFLNCEISEGIFHWIVHPISLFESSFRFHIGISPSDLISRFDDYILGGFDGSCCFMLGKGGSRLLLTEPFGVENDLGGRHEVCVTSDSTVAIEVNANTRMLRLFVDERIVPRVITHIHLPLYLGMSGYSNASVTSVSFRRHPTSAALPSSCLFYKCNERGKKKVKQ